MSNITNVSKEMPVVPLKKNKIIGILGIVMLVSVMNSTMFTVAIPEISLYFTLKPSEVSWIMTSYIIVFSIGSLIYGKYVDIYPLKNVLTIGLIILGFGSFLGFVSPNYSIVIVSRIIQACGAASITSLAFVSASRYFPEEKGKVIGVFSSIMALGTGLGPILGGFITGLLSWQYLFLVSSFVWAAVPFVRMWIPTEEKKEGYVDFFGALLIATVVASIILFITTFYWLWFLTSVIFIVFSVFWIFKSKKPFIEPAMFANVYFSITILISFLGVFTMFASMFTLTFLLNEVHNLSTIYIGLVIFPGAMIAAFVGSYVGRLTDHIGSVPVAYFSFVLLIISFLFLSIIIGQSPWIISLVFIANFVAFPFFQTATINLVQTILSRNQTGVGIGIYQLFNFMAGGFAGAIVGKLLDNSSGFKWKLNPLSLVKGKELIYSNIFLGLLLVTLLNACILYIIFKRFNPLESINNE